jgi:hypothetical protein
VIGGVDNKAPTNAAYQIELFNISPINMPTHVVVNKLPNFPLKIAFAYSTYYQNSIYVFGGFDVESVNDNIYALNLKDSPN